MEPTIHFYTNVMIRMKARKDYGGMFRLYEAVKEKGLTPHLSMYKMLALSHNINNEYSLLLSDMAVGSHIEILSYTFKKDQA